MTKFQEVVKICMFLTLFSGNTGCVNDDNEFATKFHDMRIGESRQQLILAFGKKTKAIDSINVLGLSYERVSWCVDGNQYIVKLINDRVVCKELMQGNGRCL